MVVFSNEACSSFTAMSSRTLLSHHVLPKQYHNSLKLEVTSCPEAASETVWLTAPTLQGNFSRLHNHIQPWAPNYKFWNITKGTLLEGQSFWGNNSQNDSSSSGLSSPLCFILMRVGKSVKTQLSKNVIITYIFEKPIFLTYVFQKPTFLHKMPAPHTGLPEENQ